MSAKLGDKRSLVLVENLSRTHLVKYAGASGDFNPLHHDDEFARSAGQNAVIAHGMFTMGLTGRLLTDWFGTSALRSFTVRFRGPVHPGDTLTATAEVTAVADGVATVTLQTLNQHGEVVLAGGAEAAL